MHGDYMISWPQGSAPPSPGFGTALTAFAPHDSLAATSVADYESQFPEA